jgi:hypothetical protein
MKTFTQRNLPEENRYPQPSHVHRVADGQLARPLAQAPDANDGFQYNVLFNPSPAQLKAEDRGQVMIYDGLDNAVVERALDEQFGRIEHMMFVRTRQSSSDDDDDGEGYVEDDGC